jgi:hypothetical protein
VVNGEKGETELKARHVLIATEARRRPAGDRDAERAHRYEHGGARLQRGPRPSCRSEEDPLVSSWAQSGGGSERR